MKFYIKTFILSLVVFCSACPVFALEDTAIKKQFTIDDCIEYALENSPNIKNAKSKVEVYKSKTGQAKSDYFPSLGGSTGYNFSEEKNSYNGSSNSDYYNIDVSVNQLIWDFDRNSNIDMSKYNQKSVEYDLNNEILNTIYAVKTSYFEVLAAKANSEVLTQTVEINKLNYERTNALFEEGLKSKIDVVNAEVNYTDAKIRLLESQNMYESALIKLANSMYYTDTKDFTVLNTENFNFKPVNYTPNEIKVNYVQEVKDAEKSELILTSGIEKHNVLENFKFKPYDISVEKALEKAYENRPDLKSLELVAKATNESLKMIKRSYLPDLSASAGYNFRKTEDMHTNSLRVYAGLNLPLLNVMEINYRIKEGESLLDIAEENVDLSKKNIYFEIQNYYVNMKQLEKRIPLMAQKVQQTLENFELADGRYTVGLGNFIELQDAQTNYNNAQLEFVQIVFKYNVAREEFLKSMGVK